MAAGTPAPLTKGFSSALRSVNRDKRQLAANTKVWAGGLAAMNASGYVQPATGAATETVIGFFYESVDNTGGAAGALSVDVHYGRERWLRLYDNDTGAPLSIADREKPCTVLDDHTVTAHDGTKSNAGTVYDVTTEGVWIEFPLPSA